MGTEDVIKLAQAISELNLTIRQLNATIQDVSRAADKTPGDK